MCSTVTLREFIVERLTAAAEDIFSVFEQTIVRYEEEIDRQRRLLDIGLKPRISLTRIDIGHYDLRRGTCVHVDPQDQTTDNQEQEKPPQTKEDHEDSTLQQKEEQLLPPPGQDGAMKVKDEETHQAEATPTSEEPLRENAPPQETLRTTSITSEVSDSGGLKCTKCGKDLTRKVPQKRQTPENQRDETLLYCPTCEKRPKEEEAERCPPVCAICGKTFTAIKYDDAYRKPHAWEKLYICNVCEKQTSLPSSCSLNRGKTKAAAGPLSCKTCGKGFSHAASVRRHMLTHAAEKPFSCATCGRQFKQSSTFHQHMRIHSGVKPFSCETCRKTFRHRCSLVRHMVTHTKEKPYICICGKSYGQHSSLARHRVTHGGRKLFPCEMCGKAYFYRCDLLQHQRKLHS